MEKENRLEDILVTGFLLFLFAIILVNLGRLIGPFHPNAPFETGPSFFPRYLILGVLALLLALILTQFSSYRKNAGSQSPSGAETCGDETPSVAILVKTIPAIFLFIYFMDYLGFLISGMLLLSALQVILGNRIWWKIFVFSGGVLVFCFLVFIKILYIQLPRGIGVFEQFSLLFY